MTFQFVLMELVHLTAKAADVAASGGVDTRSGMRRALRAAVTMMGAVAEWR
jgi:hypothetical protein